MDFCIYDSRLSAFKQPFGAVAAGETVRFSIHLPKNLCVKSAHLVLCCDGESDRFFPMQLDECTMRYNCYSIHFVAQHPKLYFYYFGVTTEDGSTHVIHANESMRGELSVDTDRYWQLTVYDPKMKRPASLGNGILYQIFPDRFCNSGTPKKNVPADRTLRSDWGNLPVYLPNEEGEITNSDYFGGDLAGIEQHLDYFSDLGVTALWFTPVLENNMTGGSYHGYATTDYYKVDPRFGTNEEYKQLIEKAHARGIKIVMDMIFNHCGVEHVWIKDMPSKDWFNNPDHENNFVQTSFKLTPHVDPYTSQYDADQMNDGWFVPSMPDLNQKNPHVYRYLVQNSFWWIEFANIDGIRMDTYPYADYDAMSNWMKELNEEYPNYNTVGETWVTEPAYTAWWQKDSKLSAPKNSNLKTVMDFSFFDKINTAKNEQTETWFKGLDRIYNNFVYDFLYPNPASVLAFIENHDTDRFLGEGNNLPMLKQASTLLLTTRRIPQLYYGTEVMMNGVKSKSDGYVRKDFPGGWTGDATNALTPAGRTKIQNECYDFYKTILNWRKGNDVIAKGSMVQFMVQNGVYAYARQYEGKTIFVMLNGTDAETTVPLKFYKEILKNSKQGKDILSGKAITFGEELKMGPRESLVIEL